MGRRRRCHGHQDHRDLQFGERRLSIHRSVGDGVPGGVRLFGDRDHPPVQLQPADLGVRGRHDQPCDPDGQRGHFLEQDLRRERDRGGEHRRLGPGGRCCHGCRPGLPRDGCRHRDLRKRQFRDLDRHLRGLRPVGRSGLELHPDPAGVGDPDHRHQAGLRGLGHQGLQPGCRRDPGLRRQLYPDRGPRRRCRPGGPECRRGDGRLQARRPGRMGRRDGPAGQPRQPGPHRCPGRQLCHQLDPGLEHRGHHPGAPLHLGDDGQYPGLQRDDRGDPEHCRGDLHGPVRGRHLRDRLSDHRDLRLERRRDPGRHAGYADVHRPGHGLRELLHCQPVRHDGRHHARAAVCLNRREPHEGLRRRNVGHPGRGPLQPVRFRGFGDLHGQADRRHLQFGGRRVENRNSEPGRR